MADSEIFILNLIYRESQHLLTLGWIILLTILIFELNSNCQLWSTGEICTVHIECCFLCDCRQCVHSLMHFPRCRRYSSDTKRLENKALNVNIVTLFKIFHKNKYSPVNFFIAYILRSKSIGSLKHVFSDVLVQAFKL